MYNLILVSIVVLVYFFATLGLYIFQRSLLYHPTENNYGGDRLTVNIEKVKIVTEDNIDLLAWYHNKDINKFKTILYLHGNAGSLENRIHKINHFEDMNINFLLLSRRGFSGNKGEPTEQGLYQDARSAVKWLIKQGVFEENIIIYGESLGTGVAVEIAQKKNYAGIILESPFTSMIDMGKKYYPFFPVRFLLQDKFESYKKINKIFVPVLIIHGKVDKIVPHDMGKTMYELSNEPKYFYSQEYGDHMVDYDEKLLLTLKEFIQSLN